MQAKNDDGLATDLLHGCREIAAYLGLTERQAFHQIEKGNIPTTRMGRKLVASKAVLRRRFAPSEAVVSE